MIPSHTRLHRHIFQLVHVARERCVYSASQHCCSPPTPSPPSPICLSTNRFLLQTSRKDRGCRVSVVARGRKVCGFLPGVPIRQLGESAAHRFLSTRRLTIITCVVLDGCANGGCRVLHQVSTGYLVSAKCYALGTVIGSIPEYVSLYIVSDQDCKVTTRLEMKRKHSCLRRDD